MQKQKANPPETETRDRSREPQALVARLVCTDVGGDKCPEGGDERWAEDRRNTGGRARVDESEEREEVDSSDGEHTMNLIARMLCLHGKSESSYVAYTCTLAPHSLSLRLSLSLYLPSCLVSREIICMTVT
jgi:hypothetical protein